MLDFKNARAVSSRQTVYYQDPCDTDDSTLAARDRAPNFHNARDVSSRQVVNFPETCDNNDNGFIPTDGYFNNN
jgi:hypothetical protein